MKNIQNIKYTTQNITSDGLNHITRTYTLKPTRITLTNNKDSIHIREPVTTITIDTQPHTTHATFSNDKRKILTITTRDITQYKLIYNKEDKGK